MSNTQTRETASNGAAVVNRNIHTVALSLAALEQDAEASSEMIGFDQQMASLMASEDTVLESALERLIGMIEHREDALARMKAQCAKHSSRGSHRSGYYGI